MKNIFTLLFLAMSYMAFAQPVIESSWLPGTGLELMQQSLDPSTVDAGPAGADVTWDFTAAVTVDTVPPLTITFVDPAGTPYDTSFPEANLAYQGSFGGFSAYGYTKVSNNQFDFLGVGSGFGSVVYTDPEIIFKTPFTYNSSFEDDYEAVNDFSGNQTTTHGHTYVTADAYGTVVFQDETFENVLRIMRVSETRDTFEIFTFKTIDISIDTSYEWISTDFSYPMMVYTSSTGITLDLNQATQEYDTTSVTNSKSAYRELNAGATATDDIDEESFDWSIYPNPVQNRLSVSWPDDIEVDRIRIADLKGSVMQVQQIPDGQTKMEVKLDRSLGHGMHFLTLESEDGKVLGQKRFVRNR